MKEYLIIILLLPQLYLGIKWTIENTKFGEFFKALQFFYIAFIVLIISIVLLKQ